MASAAQRRAARVKAKGKTKAKTTPATRQAGRQQRVEQRFLQQHPIYDPSQTLSGTGLASAVRDLVNADISPQVGAVDRQAASTMGQGLALGRNVSGYYRDLAGQEAQRVAGQQAITGRLNDNLGKIASDSQAASAQGGKDALASLDTGTTGADSGLQGDSRQRLAAEMAARADRSGATSQAYRSAGAQQGASNESLQTAMASAHQARGGEQLGEFNNRTANTLRDLTTKRSDLLSQAGPLSTKYLTQLRQQGVENQVTMAGLGIKQADLQQQASQDAIQNQLNQQRIGETGRSNRSREQLAQRNADIAAGRASETGRHNTVQEGIAQQNANTGAQRAKQVGKGGGPTRAQSNSARAAMDRARAILGEHPSPGVPSTTARRRASQSLIRQVRGLPKPLADAAVQLEVDGKVASGLARTIKEQYGLSLPSEKGHKPKRSKSLKGVKGKGSG